MKPKLIIINGPLGSGKSTLAQMYADRHQITLKLDIDQVWELISGWREEPDKTTSLAKRMAIAMAEIHLNAGHDVVIPQFFYADSQYVELENLARKCNADFYEVFIDIPKHESIDRYIKRGQAGGNPDGFRPNSIVKKLGGISKLEEMHDQSKAVTDSRPMTIRIVPRFNALEETYTVFMESLNRTKKSCFKVT